MKEGPGKRDILSRPASKKAAARPRSAPPNEPKPVPVPLPEGVRHQRVGETTERSAHLEKLKQLFEAAPISRYLGMTLSYCENGVARVRLPFRAELIVAGLNRAINAGSTFCRAQSFRKL